MSRSKMVKNRRFYFDLRCTRNAFAHRSHVIGDSNSRLKHHKCLRIHFWSFLGQLFSGPFLDHFASIFPIDGRGMGPTRGLGVTEVVQKWEGSQVMSSKSSFRSPENIFISKEISITEESPERGHLQAILDHVKAKNGQKIENFILTSVAPGTHSHIVYT